MKSAPYWLFKIITALIKTSAWYYFNLTEKMRVKMDEFQNSLFLRGWLRDPFNFLGRVFLNKWPCCCSCRKFQIYTPWSTILLLSPPSPLTFDISLSVCSFYVLCKFSFGLRVTARKTIKQRRGKFKPGAAAAAGQQCLVFVVATNEPNTMRM